MNLAFIHNQIDNNNFHEAQTSLNEQKPQSSYEKRIYFQLFAKLLFRQGEFNKAIEAIKSAQTFGQHISLLSDLCSYYYLSGDILNWIQTLGKFKSELALVLKNISNEYKIKCSINLGNQLEEMGELAQAADVYFDCLNNIKNIADDKLIYRVKSQMIRLHQGNYKNINIKDYYYQIKSIQFSYPDLYQSITTQHSLFHFELSHISVEFALLRFLDIKNNLTTIDINLFIIDLIEHVLMFKIDFNLNLVFEYLQGNDLTNYEKCILKFAQNDYLYFKENIIELSRDVSPANFIRLLVLYCERNDDSDLNAQLRIILGALTNESLSLWEQFIPSLNNSKLLLTLERNILTEVATNRKIDLTKKKSATLLLESFIKQKSYTLDQLTEKLWAATYNISYYDRIRMVVNRTNKNIGIKDLLVFSTQGVHLNSDYKILG